MSIKKGLVIIGIIIVIVLCIYLLPIRNMKKRSASFAKAFETTHFEQGNVVELEEETNYQFGNLKLTFKIDKENDKISIYHDDTRIVLTDYNHGAKVRVNTFNKLYFIEIIYTMAQCKTISLFELDSNGTLLQTIGSDTEGTISNIEYYSDVNKIIIYKEPCTMGCDNCGKKYTYLVNDTKTELISTEEKYDDILVEVEKEEDYTYYSFNFNKAFENKNSYQFDIGKYQLKYEKTKEENSIKYYDLYIDSNKIYSDAIDVDNIKLVLLGDYLLFTNTFTTSIRSTRLYIYEGTKLREIYELDTSTGMVAQSKDSIVINKDGILIKGTRINNGPSIINDDKIYDMYSKETCSSTLKILNDNFIVQQEYTYKYSKSKLDFTSKKGKKYTLKDYAKREEFCNNTVES